MPRRSFYRRAPLRGAFFIFSTLLATASPATVPECPLPAGSERVRVKHVIDGDTLRLADDRRLRLIGINAPESRRGEHPPQPLATAAGAALEALLEQQGYRLTLHFDSSRQDHYRRLLAHASLPDGSNPAEHLLEQGLATALAVPPNTGMADCYQRLEQRARATRRGIWALPAYRSVAAAGLRPDARGFRLVQGRINKVRHSRHSVWLQLDGPLAARISRRDLSHFPADYPDSLLGQRVELRGWLKPDGDGLKVSIRHPAAITRLVDGQPPEEKIRSD
jgi:endonuclease YncB( thermonuclease family)